MRRSRKAQSFLTIVVSVFLIQLSCEVVLSVETGTLPKRIVSLGPINTENVYLLGAGDSLVGSTVYCVRPEAAKETAKIGSVMHISVEKVVSLKPDLVLATPLTPVAQLQILEKVGIKVVRFEHPSSFEASCRQFEELGRLLGLEERAKEITEILHRQIKTMNDQIVKSGLPPPKVIMQVGANPLFISGKDSFTNDFIELLRAENAIGSTLSRRVGYERIIAANPDVILIGIMGSEKGVAAEEKKKWKLVRGIKAVQEDRVFVVNPNIVCSPSPATFVQGLRIILPLLYPDLSAKDIGERIAIGQLSTHNQ